MSDIDDLEKSFKNIDIEDNCLSGSDSASETREALNLEDLLESNNLPNNSNNFNLNSNINFEINIAELEAKLVALKAEGNLVFPILETIQENNIAFANSNISNMANNFKPEYLNCVPQFDGNPCELNRYLATCKSLIDNFYDVANANCFQNIYLINSLIGKLSGNARLVVNVQNVSS